LTSRCGHRPPQAPPRASLLTRSHRDKQRDHCPLSAALDGLAVRCRQLPGNALQSRVPEWRAGRPPSIDTLCRSAPVARAVLPAARGPTIQTASLKTANDQAAAQRHGLLSLLVQKWQWFRLFLFHAATRSTRTCTPFNREIGIPSDCQYSFSVDIAQYYLAGNLCPNSTPREGAWSVPNGLIKCTSRICI